MVKLVDLTGRRFGRLTVTGIAFRRKTPKGQTRIFWLCQCDCGEETAVVGLSLGRGSQSCGCLRSEMVTAKNMKHGMSRSPEATIWSGMKKRCQNANSEAFKDYGGRGIKVCEQWSNSFETFLADMGQRPSPSHSIDRINNDGNYEPGNCRWATPEEQANNQRTNVKITVNGIERTVSQWARILKADPTSIFGRLAAGWDPERAVTEPPRHW